MPPVLDYIPRLDPRNLAHLVRDSELVEAAGPSPMDTAIWWTGGTVLDQGQEGSCVGHGTVGEYLASPVRGHVADAARGHELAVQVYNRAKEIDEWEGVAYDGTSVRAGMLVHRERGWSTAFKWAKNVEELRVALTAGPVVIGVDWYSGMYSTDCVGRVKVTGENVGGHCLLVTGYSPSWNGSRRFRLRNSWGPSYGVGGNGYITPEDLQRILFDAGGEAAVVTGRALGK